MNIGRADQLGSGIRNLYTYTKLYSGGVPELIEGDIFKTIIPLVRTSGKQANNKRIKQANKTSDKKIETVAYLEKHGKVTVAELAEIFNLSEARVRAILLEMTNEGVVEKIGKTKAVYYVSKS